MIDDSRVVEVCKWHLMGIQSLQGIRSCVWAVMVGMRFMTQWRSHGPIQEACPHNQATTVTKLHVTCRVRWRPSLLNAFRPRWNSVTGYGSWGLEAAHNPRPAAPDWPYTCRVWRRYHAHEVVDKECRHMRMHMQGGYDDINRNSEYGNAAWKFALLLTLPLSPLLCNSIHHSYS